jgi:hypothetical protein
MAVDDETHVVSRDLASAFVTRKGLVLERDFAFISTIIANILSETIRGRC